MGEGEGEEHGGVGELFNVLNDIAGFHVGSLVGAEDFSDKVNYKWTGSLLLFAGCLILVRDFTFNSIQCYIPPEWPYPWEQYTENYCWVQNNYRVSYFNTTFPATGSERTSLELNYYQWVPFMLALQWLLFQFPHAAWRFLSTRSGFDSNGLVRLAKRSVTLDEGQKGHIMSHIASEIMEAMELHEARGLPLAPGTRRNCVECLFSTLPCFWLGRPSGFSVFFMFLVSKLLYLAAALGHLFLMRNFLGFEELHFGWNCAKDLLQGRQWQQTRVFPRVTFCDVPVKHVGQWNTRSVQCVLPLNVFNEKLYIFLWFWTVMCITLTSVSTVVWLVKILVPKFRQQFVNKHLNKLNMLVEKAKNPEEYQLREEFISVFLSLDGLFLLSMIEHNVGKVCVIEIIFSLYGEYRRRRQHGGDPEMTETQGHEDVLLERESHEGSPCSTRSRRSGISGGSQASESSSSND